MARTLDQVEPRVAAAIARYLAKDASEAESAQVLGQAVAALIGVLLDGDDRWSQYSWVDDVLPDRVDLDGATGVALSGLVITGDEHHQWIEPFQATIATSPSGTELTRYEVSVGDAAAGLATVPYGGRRPVEWPDVPAWLFSFRGGTR
jgi:hypothetical protein